MPSWGSRRVSRRHRRSSPRSRRLAASILCGHLAGLAHGEPGRRRADRGLVGRDGIAQADRAQIFTETFNNICPETYFFYVAEINGQYISFESEPSWIRPTPKLITSYKEIIEEAKAHGIPVGKFLFFQFEENGVTTHQVDMSKAIHFTNPKSLVEHVKAGGEISYFVDSAFCFYIDWSPA